MPVNTGTGLAAIASAIDSASKVANSLRAPPPRTTTITSSSVTRDSSLIEAVIISAASSPWTRVSATRRWNPKPLRANSSWRSCQAAEPTLVTTPIRKGTAGTDRRRFAS